MKKKTRFELFDTPQILLVGIYAPYNKTSDMHSYFEEFINLAKTNGLDTQYTLFFTLRTIDAAYFLTKGKLETVKQFCLDNQIDHVIISEQLSPQQERNLQSILGAKVFDRTRLILDIFEKSAQSAEGKTQVQIASLQYKKSRLAGRGIHLSQQAGRIGVRGPGETAKERELNHIEQTIVRLKKELMHIEQSRSTQRKRRITRQIPLLCLIGYTNSGKSTILNMLTKSNVRAENKLFATLDTTTRELYIHGIKIGLISDTVGFIQQLPHHLIEAFKSTLSELLFADLLLHVVDISDQNWESHISIVHTILKDLNVHKKMLYVFNKVDRCLDQISVVSQTQKYQPQVVISALSEKGIEPLIQYLAVQAYK